MWAGKDITGALQVNAFGLTQISPSAILNVLFLLELNID
jgi:hypothetical protein